MQQCDADNLADELFDPDLPNVAEASFDGCDPFYGSLSREHVETDEIVGVRSVFLCPTFRLEGLSRGHVITIGSTDYIAAYIQTRGRTISAVVLARA